MSASTRRLAPVHDLLQQRAGSVGVAGAGQQRAEAERGPGRGRIVGVTGEKLPVRGLGAVLVAREELVLGGQEGDGGGEGVVRETLGEGRAEREALVVLPGSVEGRGAQVQRVGGEGVVREASEEFAQGGDRRGLPTLARSKKGDSAVVEHLGEEAALRELLDRACELLGSPIGVPGAEFALGQPVRGVVGPVPRLAGGPLEESRGALEVAGVKPDAGPEQLSIGEQRGLRELLDEPVEELAGPAGALIGPIAGCVEEEARAPKKRIGNKWRRWTVDDRPVLPVGTLGLAGAVEALGKQQRRLGR
jgi:hypothetical protein